MIHKFKTLVKIVTLSVILAVGCGFTASTYASTVVVGVYATPTPYYGGVRYYRYTAPYPGYYYRYHHGYRYRYYYYQRYYYPQHYYYPYHHYYRHW